MVGANKRKVKVFKFRVSNATSSICSGDEHKSWYREKVSELVTQLEIESIVNKFLETVDVLVDIKVNTVDVEYHNNGRGNTVDMIYTVIYE